MLLTKPIWLCVDRIRQWQDRRTLLPTQALGRRGEDVAHRYLQRKGYRVIDRNWRSRNGLSEVDLIAWQRGTPDRLVFVEVKSRTNDEFGSPDRNIDRDKITALRRAAREYCRKGFVDEELVRFDTISIVFEPTFRLEHDTDAFSWKSS